MKYNVQRPLYPQPRRDFLRNSLISLTGLLLFPHASPRAQQISATAVAWNADGTTLAVGTAEGIYLYDAALQPQALIPDSGADIRALAWHADRLAAARYDGLVRLYAVKTGQRLLTLRGHIGVVNAISWNTAGSQLVTAGDDMSLRVWDAYAGDELNRLQKHRDRVYSVAWQPDHDSGSGHYLVSGAADNAVFLWDMRTGLVQPTGQFHSYHVYAVAWSPDGTHYASAGRDKSVRIWGANGSAVAGYTAHTDRVLDVTWSIDSKRLFSSSWDRTVRVWSLEQRQVVTLAEDLPERARQISIDPVRSNYAVIGDDRVLVRPF